MERLRKMLEALKTEPGFSLESRADLDQVRLTQATPDHAWLALMRGAMADFDPDATFEPKYARFRRYGDDREALPYQGEFEGMSKKEGQ